MSKIKEEFDVNTLGDALCFDKNKAKKQKLSLLEQREQILSAYRDRCKDDFMFFTRGLTIASQKGPRVFENCIAPFQRECFEDMAPSIHAVRDGNMPDMRRFWIERTKKASKDADLAVIMIWLLCFPTRPLYMQVGAANREQAGIVKERMTHLLHWNPWLNEHMEIIQSEARSKKKMANGSPMVLMNILSSDVAGAHGGTPDVLIINELSHITKMEFAENLMDNADGVAQGIVIIATNAGIKGTKAEVWRNNALTSKEWSPHILAKPAPWHSKDTIADAKRRNTPSRFARLWKGAWQSGKGDAVSEEAIDRSFRMKGPILLPKPGWIYIGGLDLGISHDHSGLAILGVNEQLQEAEVAFWKAWEPLPETGEVDLTAVEEGCLLAHKIYRSMVFFYDPCQAVLMAQRLRKLGVPMREMTFSNTNNLTKMATAFLNLVDEGKLACYDDPEGRMRRDFGKFHIVEKSYGYKLEAVSDEYGHADVGTALAMTLPAAVELMNGTYGLAADDDLVEQNDEPLSKEEIEELPEEFRDLMGTEEGIATDHKVFGKEKRRGQSYDPFDDIS